MSDVCAVLCCTCIHTTVHILCECVHIKHAYVADPSGHNGAWRGAAWRFLVRSTSVRPVSSLPRSSALRHNRCVGLSLAVLVAVVLDVLLSATAKTNNKMMPLLQLLGIDGNYKSFTAAHALLYDETGATFEWVLQCCAEAFSPSVCSAVHLVMGDDDSGQNSAFGSEVCKCAPLCLYAY